MVFITEVNVLYFKIRERELENLLAKKEDSLRQSERLRNLYSREGREEEVVISLSCFDLKSTSEQFFSHSAIL